MTTYAAPDPATTKWVPLGYGATIQTNVPAAHITHNANQTIAASTLGQIALNTVRFDTDAITSTVNRLTCKTAGKYQIGACLHFQTAGAANVVDVGIRLNGGSYVCFDRRSIPVMAGYGTQFNMDTVWDLIVGDYLDLVVNNVTNGVGTIYTSSYYSPELWMTYIGPGLLGRGQQNISGTYLTRPAANTVPAGTTYFATDTYGTWLSDGSTWTLIGQRAPLISSAMMSAAPFTTPYDQQEIVLTDSFANPNYRWHLRYNAASSSSYKWECIGGTPFMGYSSGTVSNGASTGVWVNIVATAITPPRTGEYRIQGTTQTNHPTAGSTNYLIFWAGSVPGGIFGPAMATGFPVAGGYSAVIAIGPFTASMVGGNGIGLAGQSNYANGNWSSNQWEFMPIRVQ